MATYTKGLKSVTVGTLMGNRFHAEDTVDGDRIGTNAIEAINKKETVTVKHNENEVLIPFHAVGKSDWETTTESAEKSDPYGCDGASGGEVWYTGTLGECQNGKAVATVSETDKAKTTDLATSPTNYDVSMNGNTLQYWAEESPSDSVAFIDDETEQNYVVIIAYGADGFIEGIVYIKCPTDITTVEITVAKK